MKIVSYVKETVNALINFNNAKREVERLKKANYQLAIQVRGLYKKNSEINSSYNTLVRDYEARSNELIIANDVLEEKNVELTNLLNAMELKQQTKYREVLSYMKDGTFDSSCNFDMGYDEDEEKYYIVLGYCCYGGCSSELLYFDTEKQVEQYNAVRSILGFKPGTAGICGDCSAEYYESII